MNMQEVKDAVIQLKAIEQIPKSQRQPIHDKEFLQNLNIVRTHQIEFFEQLTKARFSHCECLFSRDKNGNIVMSYGDSDVDLNLDKIKTPVLSSKDLTTDEINELIVQIENSLSTIYGGLYELKPVQVVFNSTYEWAESVYKGLCLSDKEWEGECVFAMLIPEVFLKDKMFLDMLVMQYQVKLEQLQSTYEKLSRMIALRLVEPGEIQRGQKEFVGTDFKRTKK